ncbi:MAG: hypothetical protein EP341_09040 [Sphingomonadales bacterium]|nr:MAG: hypothetical protein EP341_09040 [Sphingomonadales bacterium]
MTALALSACAQPAEEAAEAAKLASDSISAATFGCIRDLEPVDRFFVGNLDGDIEATLAVARSETGGTYPVGSVVQLVPTEAMVKRAAGYSAATNDWEFFDLDISPEGTKILTRGHADVVNRFGGNCLECHAKAEPQWDMICSTTHGCDPIPINDAMIRGLQKTDPRCEAAELTADEQEGLAQLQALMGG